jgi:hypothetical protein
MVWTDGQNKYSIKDQSDNTIHEDIKIVYTGVGGTPLSAANMNNLENTIADVSSVIMAMALGGLGM